MGAKTSGSTPAGRSCGRSQIQISPLLGFGPYGFVYSFIKVIFHSPKIDFSSVINKNVIFHVIGLLMAEPEGEKNPFAGHTPHPTLVSLPWNAGLMTVNFCASGICNFPGNINSFSYFSDSELFGPNI